MINDPLDDLADGLIRGILVGSIMAIVVFGLLLLFW
jgi:hypothetical protein